MVKYFDVLSKCILFKNINKDDLLSVIKCLGGIIKSYSKDDIIISEGDNADILGVILEGSVHITRIDYYGNRDIIAGFKKGEIFGETISIIDNNKMLVNVIADEDTKVLIIKMKKILSPCDKPCYFHKEILLNLLHALAKKNIMFNKKIEIMSKKTTKEKLMCYLSFQAKENNSSEFEIPFNRQELADYLGVERSGLSVEINKLKKDGIIDSNKNYFKIN